MVKGGSKGRRGRAWSLWAACYTALNEHCIRQQIATLTNVARLQETRLNVTSCSPAPRWLDRIFRYPSLNSCTLSHVNSAYVDLVGRIQAPVPSAHDARLAKGSDPCVLEMSSYSRHSHLPACPSSVRLSLATLNCVPRGRASALPGFLSPSTRPPAAQRQWPSSGAFAAEARTRKGMKAGTTCIMPRANVGRESGRALFDGDKVLGRLSLVSQRCNGLDRTSYRSTKGRGKEDAKGERQPGRRIRRPSRGCIMPLMLLSALPHVEAWLVPCKMVTTYSNSTHPSDLSSLYPTNTTFSPIPPDSLPCLPLLQPSRPRTLNLRWTRPTLLAKPPKPPP